MSVGRQNITDSEGFTKFDSHAAIREPLIRHEWTHNDFKGEADIKNN
jgi:hypothetical protein